MLYMTSFNLKEGRVREFQAWVKKNEDLFQKYAPKGWTYRGTYGYVLGFGRFGAATMWECRTYGDFDNWREHDEPTWMRLFGEMQDLVTNDIGESVLLREIGDVRVLEKSTVEEPKTRRAR